MRADGGSLRALQDGSPRHGAGVGGNGPCTEYNASCTGLRASIDVMSAGSWCEHSHSALMVYQTLYCRLVMLAE